MRPHACPALAITLGALALAMSSAAQARSFGSYSGWQVDSDDSDHSCTLGREHEGPGSTIMGIGTSLEDEATTLFITNANWSIKEGEAVKVAMRLDGITGYIYTSQAVGFTSGGSNGLAMSMSDRDFLRDFAAASGIKFFRIEEDGEKPRYTVIDYLDLDGTGAAIAAYRRCLDHERSVVAAEKREKDRWKDIPADPFKKPE